MLFLQILGVTTAMVAIIASLWVTAIMPFFNWGRGHNHTYNYYWMAVLAISSALAIWQPFAYGWL